MTPISINNIQSLLVASRPPNTLLLQVNFFFLYFTVPDLIFCYFTIDKLLQLKLYRRKIHDIDSSLETYLTNNVLSIYFDIVETIMQNSTFFNNYIENNGIDRQLQKPIKFQSIIIFLLLV